LFRRENKECGRVWQVFLAHLAAQARAMVKGVLNTEFAEGTEFGMAEADHGLR
jgi:hypothetical protein